MSDISEFGEVQGFRKECSRGREGRVWEVKKKNVGQEGWQNGGALL
jgi:hypothetical protein